MNTKNNSFLKNKTKISHSLDFNKPKLSNNNINNCYEFNSNNIYFQGSLIQEQNKNTIIKNYLKIDSFINNNNNNIDVLKNLSDNINTEIFVDYEENNNKYSNTIELHNNFFDNFVLEKNNYLYNLKFNKADLKFFNSDAYINTKTNSCNQFFKKKVCKNNNEFDDLDNLFINSIKKRGIYIPKKLNNSESNKTYFDSKFLYIKKLSKTNLSTLLNDNRHYKLNQLGSLDFTISNKAISNLTKLIYKLNSNTTYHKNKDIDEYYKYICSEIKILFRLTNIFLIENSITKDKILCIIDKLSKKDNKFTKRILISFGLDYYSESNKNNFITKYEFDLSSDNSKLISFSYYINQDKKLFIDDKSILNSIKFKDKLYKLLNYLKKSINCKFKEYLYNINHNINY